MRDAELTPTGRELKEPSGTLIECTDPKGLKHTVLAYDAAFVGHPALTTGVQLIQSFMGYPMVTGLVECNAADTRRGRFAYPTGTIWTIKEVMRGFEQIGQNLGARAAIELCYLGAMILQEAGETGALQGCFSHGNLQPWRVSLKADGQLQIFGYGLAQVEMLEFIAGRAPHIDPESIRYAPPERLEGQPEQPSSDTYSLATIAYELITGRPLFPEKDGPKMWEAVKMAEGSIRLTTDKDVPKSVREVLASALIYDPDTRLSGHQLVDAMGNLLDDPKVEGRTLGELMQTMQQATARSSRKLVKASATAAFTASDLAAMAKASASEDDDDLDLEDPESDADGPRWTPIGERTTGRGRRRAREQAEPVEGSTRRAPARPELGAEEEGVRRRRRREAEPAAEAAPVAPPPTLEEGPRRRRRRPLDEAGSLELENDEGDDGPRTLPPELPRRRRRPAPVMPAAEDDEATLGPDDDDSAEEVTLPPPLNEDEEEAVPPVAPAEAAIHAVEGAIPVSELPGEDGELRRRRRRLPETETANPATPAEPDVAETPSSPLSPDAPADPPAVVPVEAAAGGVATVAPGVDPSVDLGETADGGLDGDGLPRRRRRRLPDGAIAETGATPETNTALGSGGGSAHQDGDLDGGDPASALRRRRRRPE